MKKIKFALLLGDKPCRSLDNIRDNFNAEDIIKNFDNGVLLKWLKIYNLDELYSKASLIDKNSGNKLNELLDLFFEDKAKKEELLKNYKKEKERKIKEEKQRIEEEKRLEAENKKRLEEEYKKNYESVVKSIIKKKKDYDFIKNAISENNKILMENYSDFFEKLKSKECIFGILSVLANADTRDYFLNDKSIMKSIKDNVIKGIDRPSLTNLNKEIDKCLAVNTNKGIYKKNIDLFAENYMKKINSVLGHESLHVFEEKCGAILDGPNTKYDYIFDKIKIYREVNKKNDFIPVVKNKKCLILHINSDVIIISFKDKNKSYTYKDIDNKFLILDGINCKSSSKLAELIYMEI